MFGGRFFGARHFGRRYFGKSGLTLTGYYAGARYFGRRYFGRRYFGLPPQAGVTFSIAQTSGIALSGTAAMGSTSLAISADKAVTQVTGISLSATLGVSGALSFDSEEFDLTPPLDGPALAGTLLVSGNLTITNPGSVPGSYWGKRYFGNRHFGGRYFGRPPGFNISQTAGISLSGAAGVAGSITTAIGISPTNQLALSGALQAGALLVANTPAAEADTAPGYRRKPRSSRDPLPPRDEDLADLVREKWDAIERAKRGPKTTAAAPAAGAVPSAAPAPRAATPAQRQAIAAGLLDADAVRADEEAVILMLAEIL